MKYLLLFIVITVVGCYERKPEITGLEGKPIPSFKLLLSDSSTYFDTKTIPAGKPTVLFYISPQCPYCRAQMNEIIEDMDRLKNIHFYVFTAWPFTAMKQFYSNYQLNKYPNITAGIDYTNFFGKYFKASGVPYTAIYNKDKKLNAVFVGSIGVKEIKKSARL